jgi:hypothetical protein
MTTNRSDNGDSSTNNHPTRNYSMVYDGVQLAWIYGA